MLQTSVIVFCYLYMVGLVLAIAAPAGAAAIPFLWIATGMAMSATAALHWKRYLSPRPDIRLRAAYWGALLIAPALLGYIRYLQSDTLPDNRVGILEIREGKPHAQTLPDFSDTCRLKIRATSPLEKDLSFRLCGDVLARQPIRENDGTPAMDKNGRWRFTRIRIPQTSEVIRLQAGVSSTCETILEQPFNRITRIEILEGPSSARVELFRVSNHISSFVREGRNHAPVTILGRISQDPWVYGFKTVLTVTPSFIQMAGDGPFFKVDGGGIRLTLNPGDEEYDRLACSSAYGYDIVAHGVLSSALARSNPEGFDQRRYLSNYDVFGQMQLAESVPGQSSIRITHPDGLPPRKGNALVEFSLDLRDRLLRVLKQTLPYPQSAFLGGVSLGMRYGLQNTECVFSDQHPQRGLLGGEGLFPSCHTPIADEFRSAGVNHVLAVSGLHVTIITVMLVGLFTLLHLDRRVYVPMIVLALVVFSIITGARPSTLRAVIMNGLFLLTWAYLDKSLRSSVLLGVPIAAFLILLQNPTIIVDPSFTLSFGAILSLALLTGPCQTMLGRLTGNTLIVSVILLMLLLAAVIRQWFLVTSPLFWVVFVTAGALLLLAGKKLEKGGFCPIGARGFADLPVALGAFLAAQVAIQVGMMIPLSARYFCRWPVAGAPANLLALPLIGVVLQVGILACLVGLIPHVGIYAALVMNAANWIFSTLFLALAHFADRWFPYPFVRKPRLIGLAAYFLLCAVFIWFKPLRNLINRRPWTRRAAPYAAVLGLIGCILLIHPWEARTRPGLNITVLAVRYGSAIFVESPNGRKILIDAGFVQHDRGRINEAERTILPYLSGRGFRKLDAVMLLSPRPERAAGLAYVLQHCRVGQFIAAPALTRLLPDMDEESLLTALQMLDRDYLPLDVRQALMNELVGNPADPRQPSLARVLAERGKDSFINRFANSVITPREVSPGDVLFTEEAKGGTFSIQVLSVSPEGALAIRIVYGSFALLLPGDLDLEGQARLARDHADDSLRSSVMIAPSRGTAAPSAIQESFKADLRAALAVDTALLLDRVEPEALVFEFGNPRPVWGAESRAILRTHEITRRFYEDRLGAKHIYNTDEDGALFIHSDGQGFTLTTQAAMADAPEPDDPDVAGGF